METVKSAMKSAIERMPEALQTKMDLLSRKGKRRQVRIRHGASNRPFARFRSGVRTGTNPQFALWMADLNIRSALQRTSLVSLADRHDDALTSTAYALLHQGGFKTVWDLTQASKKDLLAAPGIGQARVSLVKADLAKHQVMVNW